MNKAVFLDRDGVINQTIFREGKPRAPYKKEEFHFFPGVVQAVEELKAAGFLTIIVTNQPDVARGWVAMESVEMINQLILEKLTVDDIRICFHTEKDQCHCRKPKPGMLLDAAAEHGIDLERSFMVGDRYSDIAAGVSAGCRSILIGDGDEKGSYPDPHFKAPSLVLATKWILTEKD